MATTTDSSIPSLLIDKIAMKKPVYPRSVIRHISRFDEANHVPRYQVVSPRGNHYLLPKTYADLLQLMDGHNTLDDISRIMYHDVEVEISVDETLAVIESQLLPLGLVDLNSHPEAKPVLDKHTATKKRELGFVFRFTITPARYADLITSRVMWTFRPISVLAAAIMILLVHFSLYGSWIVVRPEPQYSRDYLFAFLLGLASVYIHEIGHATAARVIIPIFP